MTSFQHSDVYYEDNSEIYIYEHDLFGDSFGGSTDDSSDNFDDDNREIISPIISLSCLA